VTGDETFGSQANELAGEERSHHKLPLMVLLPIDIPALCILRRLLKPPIGRRRCTIVIQQHMGQPENGLGTVKLPGSRVEMDHPIVLQTIINWFKEPDQSVISPGDLYRFAGNG
jgi:hypothetical protein